MARALFLYTDASIKGDFYSPRQRRKKGPATGAWCAWDHQDFSQRPLFSGSAFLGDPLGPQQAEYEALILGLQATNSFLASRRSPALEVIVHVDNKCVAKTMNCTWTAWELRERHERAQAEIAKLGSYVMNTEIELVKSSNAGVKVAHTMTRTGWSTALPKKEWRPSEAFTQPAASYTAGSAVIHSVAESADGLGS